MKMVKLLLSAILVLILSATAFALPDSQELGPYMVSFDVNSTYRAQIAQPTSTETANAYQMRLFVDNSTFAIIVITEYAEPTDATIKVHKSLMPMEMILREGLNASFAVDRTIDGKEGFLVTAEPLLETDEKISTVYRAMYWLDSKSCECGECGALSSGKTNVMVTSTFSKDLTESLLSSLHIVKGETTQASAPSGENIPSA